MSILAEAGQNQAVRQAHIAAVKSALSYTERYVLETRVFDPVSGKQVLSGDQKMVAALFHHDTSRNLDPQLHTHAVIANMVQGRDGKWRSVHSESLFTNKMLLGVIYRGELASNLQSLGYGIEKTHADGRFEIRGFPKDLAEHFSTRAKDINVTLEKFGARSPELASKAALFSRSRKIEVDRAELRASWQSRANELGHDLGRLDRSLQREQGLVFPDAEAGKAVKFAIDKLSERQSAFREKDLLREALAAGIGAARLADIAATLDKMRSAGQLIQANNPELSGYVTTPKAVALERATLDLMKAGYASVDPLASPQQMDKSVSPKLTDGQRLAVRHILTSPNRVIGIQGYAGTGKTTMLAEANRLAEKSSYRLLGLAPSASAAKTLADGARIEAQTLQKFLSRNEGVIDDRIGRTGLESLQQAFAKTVLVLDESSMASTRQMHDLLKIATRLNLPKLVLVGDSKQLDAVEAGKPFQQLQQAGMATVAMDQIIRQRNPDHLEAVQQALAGDVRAAFAKLKEGVIEAAPDKLAELAANSWLQLSDLDREKAGIVAPTNVLRQAINDIIRDRLKEQGRIDDKGIMIDSLTPVNLTQAEKARAGSYTAGQQILFNRDYRSLGISAGEMFTVERVDDKNSIVHLARNGKHFQWEPARVAGRTAGAMEIFDMHKRELAVGDKIRWTRNDRDRRVLNAETAKITNILWGRIFLYTQDRKHLMLPINDPQLRFADHAWANTVHAFQGQTVDKIITVMDSRHPHLTTQKSFYVGISRARDGVTLITDNAAQLQKTLERNTGERIAALDLVHRPDQPVCKSEPFKTVSIGMSWTIEPPKEQKQEQRQVEQQQHPAKEVHRDRQRTLDWEMGG